MMPSFLDIGGLRVQIFSSLYFARRLNALIYTNFPHLPVILMPTVVQALLNCSIQVGEKEGIAKFG